MDGKIYGAIVAAMADIEPIAKNQKNTGQGFMFRGIDVIMNELQPILKKHGLFLVPKVCEVQRTEKQNKSGGVLLYSIVTMQYTMYAEDGSSIVGSTVGEGMDSGDKASNKAMAVALKYFLLQTFCIPTEDTKDPDEESHELANEYETLKTALIDYVNAGAFEYPENVLAVIDARDIQKMRKALAVAKGNKHE